LLHLFIEHFGGSLRVTPAFTEQHKLEANATIDTMLPHLCSRVRDGYDTTIKGPDGKDALTLLVSVVIPRGIGDWAYQLAAAMLVRGANANLRLADAQTLLMFWSRSTALKSIHGLLLLLMHGADIDARDEAGKTAVHWLVEGAHLDMLEGLVDAGWLLVADLTQRNNAGETPLQVAQRQHGAQPMDVQRLVICDLLHVTEKLWTAKARPLVHRWLSHSLLIPDLAHVVLSFVDGKERGQ
jgi:hypothetical protein